MNNSNDNNDNKTEMEVTPPGVDASHTRWGYTGADVGHIQISSVNPNPNGNGDEEQTGNDVGPIQISSVNPNPNGNGDEEQTGNDVGPIQTTGNDVGPIQTTGDDVGPIQTTGADVGHIQTGNDVSPIQTGGAIGHSQPSQSNIMRTCKCELIKLCKFLYLIKKEMDKRNKEKLHNVEEPKKLINMSIFSIPSHICTLFRKFFFEKIPLYSQFVTLTPKKEKFTFTKTIKIIIYHKHKLYSANEGDTSISIWNPDTSQKMGELEAHSYVTCFAIHKNILYSGSSDGIILSWDLDTGNQIAKYECELSYRLIGIYSIVLHGDKLYSAILKDKSIRIWNTETHTLIKILKDINHIGLMVVNKSNLYCSITGITGITGTIRIWNTDTYEEITSLEVTPPVTDCMTIDDNKLYSVHQDSTIRIWSTETHKQIGCIKNICKYIRCIIVNKNKLYCLGYHNGIVDVWNTETLEIITSLEHSKSVVPVCITIENNYLYSGCVNTKSYESTICGWKVNDFPPKRVILGEKEISELNKNKLIRTDFDIKYAVDSWSKNKNEAILNFGHISDWNTSQVEDMSNLFNDQYKFNDNISKWDVSNVKDMECMFQFAANFNCDLSLWDVSKVQSMAYMFCNAENFNCDLSRWDVKNVESMEYMFWGAKKFNGNISTWVLGNIDRKSSIHGIYKDCKITPENQIQVEYYTDFWDDDDDGNINYDHNHNCNGNINYDCDENCDDNCDGKHTYACHQYCDGNHNYDDVCDDDDDDNCDGNINYDCDEYCDDNCDEYCDDNCDGNHNYDDVCDDDDDYNCDGNINYDHNHNCNGNINYDCDEYCDDNCDGNHNYDDDDCDGVYANVSDDDCNDDCKDDCNDELNSENKVLMEIKQNNKLYDDD